MKKFIYFVLCVSVFFVGLGTVADKVGASFKSDPKALDLLKAARTAIGGDSSLAGIQSLRIKGSTVSIWKTDGGEKSEPGETEIDLQLPDKLSKMVRIGDPANDNGAQLLRKQVETVVINGKDENGNVTFSRGQGSGTGVGTELGPKVIVLNKGEELPADVKTDGNKTIILRTTGDGQQQSKVESGELRRVTVNVNKDEMEARHRAMQQNELFRLTLGLLLSPPAGMDVNYTFGGEVKAADKTCNLVVADFGGSSVKLYLDRDSNLPVMMSYTGEEMPMFVTFSKKVDAAPSDGDKNVVFFRHNEGQGAAAEFTVTYSDYRSVNGVQLPYHWTTSGGGRSEEFDISSYEVNPTDISSSFEKPKVELRVKKDGQ
jgi:hypothetical protein